MDKMRVDFEAWVVTCRFFKKLNAHLKQNSDGSYGCYAVNDRWMAWQAARQSQERGEAWLKGPSGLMSEQLRYYEAFRRSEEQASIDKLVADARIAALESQLAESRERFALAYGLLWHVNAGVDAPWGTPSVTPERAAMESRKLLRDMLTNEQRGDGINAARQFLVALAADKEGK